ncbi:MAG: alpha-galactosidase [Spirochaetaceae bacterium]|jgi:alpha-galactosidase|nr:alpha-galactosidase [Spirochaetaceae bacterium]
MDIPGIIRAETQAGPGWRLLSYTVKQGGTQEEMARTFDIFTLNELFILIGAGADLAQAFAAEEKFLQSGGWQSWSPGWELAEGERLPRKVHIIPELLRLTNREGDRPQGGGATGHFIMYIRSGDYYLCVASLEGGGPVSYRINGCRDRVSAELYCPGKVWTAGEKMAELHVFLAKGFFQFKDYLKKIYARDFSGLDFLSGGKGGSFGDRRPGGYASWYNHYNRINEKIILDDLAALRSNDNLLKLRYLDRGRPLIFQIDDGWENAVGEWEVHQGRFPQGLKPVSEAIEKAGCVPGIWIAPFIVTKGCKVFSEKPEWLLRDKNGKPVTAGFNNLWDGRYYCLDISRPDVLACLGELIDRVIDAWGFRFIKLDFLYTGLFSGGFSRPGAPHEQYERACALLRARTANAAGLPVAYLGCGLPLGPSFRHFPLSRIGADTRETWDWTLAKLLGHTGRPSAYISLMDTIGRSFMNGTVYINDPDVIFLRSGNCALSETEKETIALVNFLLAGQIMFSDDPASLSNQDLALTRRISKLFDILSDDEYGARRVDRDVFLLQSRSGRRTGLINLRKKNYALDGTKEGDIFCKLSALVDHSFRDRRGGLSFEARSVTIFERGIP